LLDAALALWRGPALADVAYEDWAQAEIRRLEELRLDAVQVGIDARLVLGRHEAVVGDLQALVARHPEREQLVGRLMVALYRCGRQRDALDVFQRSRAWLAEELGLEPGPALVGLQRQILRQDPSLLGAALVDSDPQQAPARVDEISTPAPNGPPPGVAAALVDRVPAKRGARPSEAGRLPVPQTSLIGREFEVWAAADLLTERGHRLVTLTGPGGIGKTRLAIAVAERVAERFVDGAWFISLVALRDAGLAFDAVADELGLDRPGGRSARELVVEYLKDRSALLVLDNCEHLPGIADVVARLLTESPSVVLLATSRSILHLSFECELRVGPLDARGADSRSPAVELFVDRWRAHEPQLAVGDRQVAVAAAICERLDGLPLAIELAAARTRVLTPQAMLSRLEQHLPVLGRGGADLPKRQRTIEATIGWSYDLLDEVEQQVFARLGVFVAGWSLEAAEDVCADTGADVLDVLESLVEKSLVVASSDQASGEPRFTMLEMVREFALRRLEEAGAGDGARSAMAGHLRKLAGDGPWHYYGPDQVAWVARTTRELDNARAVMSWAQASGHDEMYVALAAGLWPAMYWRGAIPQAGQWLSRAMTLPAVPASLRLITVASACIVAGWQGTVEQASATELANALETATDPQQRSLGFVGLMLVATVAGDSYAAKAHSLAAADAARGVNPNLLLVGLHRAAGFAIELDQLDEAQEYVAEAIRTARAIGAAHSLTWVLITSGTVSLMCGDAPQAAAQYTEALDHAAELGQTHSAGTLRAVDGLACCSVAMGHSLDVATRLLASTEAQCTKSSWSLTGADAKRHARAADLVRAAFDEGRLRELWAEGAAMDATEASNAAQRLASDLLQAPTPSHPG
jgi:predicted ATPase